MKKNRSSLYFNILIIIYLIVWLYYAIFNWDILTVKLVSNLGFVKLSGYPIIFFFVFGLILLLIMKYLNWYNSFVWNSKQKETKSKLTILEKDMEILRLKETLFNMRSPGPGKSDEKYAELSEKLNKMSEKLEEEKGKNINRETDIDEKQSDDI